MTPKQIAAHLHFCARDERYQNAQALAIAALGSRGDPKALKKQHTDWTKE